SSLCVFYSLLRPSRFSFFFFKYPAPTEIYTLSLHDALPILRLASTGAVRRFLAHNKAEFDPRKYLAVSTQAMKEICIARYEAFGAAGQASKIKPVSLEAMYKRYESGELDPRVQ